MNPDTTHSDKKITLLVLLLVGFLAQIWFYQRLWLHTSNNGQFLGKYSYGYAVVLILHLILFVGWLLLIVWRKRVEVLLQHLPLFGRYTLIGLGGLVVLGLSLTSIEGVIQHYVSINWLLFSLVIIHTIPDRPLSPRWIIGLILVVGLFLIPVFITDLTERAFSPDEATWADYATSPFVAGGMYVRTWLREPLVIEPGRGWSTVIYGWILENIKFDIKVGRIFNIAGYMLGFVGIGVIAAQFYGRSAAIVSVMFAALSFSFTASYDYRPDHQLPLGLMLIMIAMFQGRCRDRRSVRRVWHFVAGFLATLTLQIHAAGVVFVFAFSLFYFAEFVLHSYRKRRITSLDPLIWFGGGILLGMVIFYFLNIAPVGGFSVYFDHLLRDRWGFDFRRHTAFLRWPSFLEWGVILMSFAYILWRRNQADRLLLSIVACVITGIFLLDAQGYRTTFSALYVIPVGALVADGLAGIQHGRKYLLTAAVIVVVLIGQMSGLFVKWQIVGDWLATGQLPPFLYTELRPLITPYVQDEDVIVGTHELIWTFPDRLGLYGYAGEYLANQRLKSDDAKGVWEQVQPTLIVEVTNQDFDPGLVAYMAEKGFQVCETLNVLNTPIHLYRTTCP